MKKNKKNYMETMPEGSKVEVEHEKGSVGEFIEMLKEFPVDGKIDLNGNIHISKDGNGATIYPAEIEESADLIPDCGEECCGRCDCLTPGNHDFVPLDEEQAAIVAKDSFAKNIMDKYSYGFDYANPEMLSALRSDSADKVLGAPIMKPNIGTLEYEENYLLPNQREMIDEIRHHNVYIAECMAEVCRRSVSAMLEYNTQILSHFAHATTKDMCRIVDNGTAGKVLECVDDEEF